jgi:hypothetical protein
VNIFKAFRSVNLVFPKPIASRDPLPPQFRGKEHHYLIRGGCQRELAARKNGCQKVRLVGLIGPGLYGAIPNFEEAPDSIRKTVLAVQSISDSQIQQGQDPALMGIQLTPNRPIIFIKDPKHCDEDHHSSSTDKNTRMCQMGAAMYQLAIRNFNEITLIELQPEELEAYLKRNIE